MELAIVMSQFQQAVIHLQRMLRKSGETDIKGAMVKTIFAQDQFEINDRLVHDISSRFDIDSHTALILQIVMSQYLQHDGSLNEYIALLVFRIDAAICMLESQSSYSSSPLQFYSKYKMNEHIQKDIRKKLRKTKKPKKK